MNRNSVFYLLALIACTRFLSGVSLAASDVSITTGATSGGSFSGGNPNVFTPTTSPSVANNATIQTALNGGNAVTVNTASAAAGNGDLVTTAPISKTAGPSATLTLNAARNLAINNTLSSTVGSRPLVLSAGRAISSTGAITTLGGNVTIDTVQPFSLGSSLNAAAGQILLQTGSLSSTAAQTITASSVNVSSGASWNQRGTLAGNLSVSGNLSPAPTSTAGSLQVNGALTLQSTATTSVDLAGTSQGSTYDSITATGAITLAGALQLNFLSGFENLIVNSDNFTLLSGSSVTGTFSGLPNNSRITLPNELGSIKITYNATNVVLSDWQPYIRDLTWDPGTHEAGTEILSQTNTRSGRHYFRINTQSTDIGAWRSRLTVTSGEADLYLQTSSIPQTLANYTHRSILTGGDGLVLRSDQYTAGQTWYLMVNATAGSQWSLVSGRAWVQDLGGLAWTDSNSNGNYDIGEPALPSGSGTGTVPLEGIRFFKTSVPAGTPAWSLWLNGSTRDIAVRKSFVPFHSATSYYDRKQAGQMLVVAPYLTGNTSTYFLSVTGNPGEAVNLDSRIQEVQDMSFNSTVSAVAVPTTPYRVYRVQVPIQQIAWDVAVTPTSGDANVCVRRDNAPAEFDNDAFSEVTGTTSDSITLVPDFLTDATWFITVYGTSPYTFTLRNGPPTITPLAFTDTKLNDQTTRAGWRFYTMTNVPSQLGSLGWELNLANQVPGTEIAIRRNAVPSRWQSRTNGSTGIGGDSRVEASGTGGFLQRPGHQADIWYVGIYTPTQALGAFTLTSAPMVATLQTFDGGVQTFSNQEPGRFTYVRIDVPAGVLGWDVRLTNVTGGAARMFVRRDQLPSNPSSFRYSSYWNGDYNSGSPSVDISWPSGNQWGATYYDYYNSYVPDWTGWAHDIGPPVYLGFSPRLLMGMGRPLEPGTYFVGVYNSSTTTAASYTIDSRGIGAGQTYPISDLAYAGGSAVVSNLTPREAKYFKVTIPANTPSWEITLSQTVGEMLLLVRRGTVPDFNAREGGYPGLAENPNRYDYQTKTQRTGPERYLIMPHGGQTSITAGDYYIAVVSEGENPNNNNFPYSIIGTGTSSGILTSVGPLAITNLGAASAAGTTQAVSLAGGQNKAFQFTVPVGTASLEVRLDNRVGNPDLSLNPGSRLPSASGYGVEGGTSAPGWVYGDNILTIANPTPGVFTLLVQADYLNGLYPDASANLVIVANAPIPLGFDAATSTVTDQSPGAWRYFQVTVPAGVIGWDVRLTNVTGGAARMFVRRDQLPSNPSSFRYSSYWNGDYNSRSPSVDISWPSGNQWGATYYDNSNSYAPDWTGWALDIGPPVYLGVSPRLLMGMGRPLEPGTYFVGVYNSSTTTATSYTIDSRGIGAGQTYPISDLAYAGGSAVVSNLTPREAKYFKVTIPANTPSWEITLSQTVGEMLLLVRRGTVPDFNARQGGYPGLAENPNRYDYQTKAQRTGPERYLIMPHGGQTSITAGDYYIAVVSEGENPNNNNFPYSIIGTGTSSGILTSVGPLAITNLGAASAAGTTQAVSLAGGQNKAFQFTVPVGTASLEVRLDNRVGNPGLNLNPGSSLPYANGYGVEGGTQAPGWVYGDSILTIANPTPGVFTLLVQADYLNGLYPDASANLVIVANAPIPLGFDAATSTVTDQSPGAWRYFQVTVPAGVMGWDVRLTNVSGDSGFGMTPQLVVRRDQLPSGRDTSVYWGVSESNTWPSGFQWAARYGRPGYGLPILDWTELAYEAVANTMPPSRLLMAMGRPLEPGIYFVGVYNPSTSIPTGYTIESRGIGTGQTYPVTNLTFAGGTSSIINLTPREAKYYKVTIPTNAPSWEVTLTPTIGEMMLKVRQGTVPDFNRDGNQSAHIGGDRQLEVRKAGPERYVMLPPYDEDTIPAGDFYLAVVSEGENPNTSNSQIGSGTSSGTLTSVGPLAVTNLGTASAAGTTTPVALAGGQVKLYEFTVPVGTASVEVRLDNRVGNPEMKLRKAGSTGSSGQYGPYGIDFHKYDLSNNNIITLANPPPGIFKLTVLANGISNTYPDASANLVVRTKPNTPLNFAASQSTIGGTHTDSRQMIDGEYTIYEVPVPPSVDGQPVTGWIIKTDVLQGAVSLDVYKNFANPTSGASVAGGFAVIVPPFLTFGETWYVRVKATGLTNYTLTSRPVTLERPVWQMPTTFNQTFGDSGNDSSGNPLPGDRGIDLGQGEWHFYAVDVPSGNLGLLRTELQAISGNPDLYIREDGVPTTSHDSNGNASSGSNLYDRQLTAAATEYGNWVPLDGRTQRQITPGRWYLGVKAAGNSNVRYRLGVSTGQVADLALNGASVNNQNLADNDWRYYRFTVPADAPANWALTFSQQVGDVVMWLRDTVPPGQGSLNTNSGGYIESWSSDNKNQGSYSNTGHDAAGAYNFTTPPLRPGHTYFAGFRSNSSATFSVSSATSGGTIGTLPVLDFYTGTLNTSIPANSSVLYRIPAPAEGTRMKWTSTHASTVQLRLEQGSIPISTGTAQHYYSSGTNSAFNNPLSSTSWPWQPDQSYYLRIVNNAASAATVILSLNGKNAATDDEDNDGLPDAWENANYGSGYSFNSYGPNDDPDADGSTNLQEFQNGTLPRDPLSVRYLLTANAVGSTIAKSPDAPHYAAGASVTLTATPTSGLTFLGWAPTAYNATTGYAAAAPAMNPLSVTMNANQAFTAYAGLPLDSALDTTGLIWTTGGPVLWSGQTATSSDGVDATRVTGPIPSNRDAWIETTVTGPGVLTWKDKLTIAPGGGSHLYTQVNTSNIQQITQTTNWNDRSYTITASGQQTVRWRFIRTTSAAVANGDEAYLDAVTYTPWSAATAQAATALTGRSFTASWTPVVGATSYTVQVSTVADLSSGVSSYGAGAATSYAVTGLTPLTTYYYRVQATGPGGLTSHSNIVNVAMPDIVRPPNDAFANAQVLSGATATATGYNFDATGEIGEPNHINASGAASSIWYRWQAPVGGIAQFDTIGSNFDTVMAVYTGSALSALTQIGQDDDSGGSNASKLTRPVTAGTTYWIAVGSYGSTRGNVTLSVAMTTPVISSATEISALQGQAFTYTIVASGNPTSFGATGLPSSLSINTGTGLITGVPTQGGVYPVVLSATNAAGTGTLSATITLAASGYAEWQSGFFNPTQLANPAISGDNVDFDNDGIANLLEFLFGGNPTLPSNGLLPTITKAPTSNHLVFSYKRKLAATGVTQVIEHTVDFSSPWTTAVHAENGVTITTSPVDASTEQVTVTIPSTSSSRFVRLRASH